jgi:PAS domain S-box-containing protein
MAPIASETSGHPFKALDNALIDALPVAVYVCDHDARIVGFNRRAVELWGREPSPDERFCGSLRMLRADGSVLPHDECPMADVLRTGEAVRDAGVVVERPDGSRLRVNVAIVPLTDASGQVTGAINTFQDVVELARADEAVRKQADAEQRSRLEALVDASAQIVWTTDSSGAVVEDSPTWRAFTGQTYDGFKGFGWLDALHPDDRERTAALWERSVADRAPLEIEYRIRHVSGEWRWTAVRAVPVLSSNGSVREWVGMNTDITDRKRAEEARRASEERLAADLIERTQAETALRESDQQLRRATASLEEAVRAHETFLSTAAHELRNPVNALQLQLVALLRATQQGGETVPREWARERVGQAVEAVRRLVRLVETLLDVSRIAAGRLELEPEPMDFAQAVHAGVNRFQDQLKEHQLTTRVAPTPGTWDRLRVEQVVTNLLSNAIKYGEGLPIEILLEGDDRTVCLSVKDHGIGIEPEHQDRLFERFERAVTRPQYGGFGLGLWITRQIVHAMEGHIAVESRPGEGSTFRVTLPRQLIRMAAHAKEVAGS